MPKKELDYQMITALAAVVLGLCALGISLVEINVMRSEQRAEVWPYLQIQTRYNQEGFAIEIENRGTGPARIQSAIMRIDNEVVRDWPVIITKVLGEGHGVDYSVYRTGRLQKQVFSSGAEQNLFSVPWTDETRRLVKGLDALTYEVCYCSIFDDCWEMTQDDLPELGKCSTNEGQQFRN